MPSGRIIEFRHSGAFDLGVVVGEVGSKYEVLNAKGVALRVHRDDVTSVVGRTDAQTPADVSRALGDVEQAASQLTIDVRELWEATKDDTRGYALDELASWVADGTVAAVATLGALRADSVYFRARHDTFEPRSEDAVASLLNEQHWAAMKHGSRGAFADAVVSALEGGISQLGDPQFHSRMQVLQKYASSNDADPHAEAVELLAEIEHRLGRALPGNGPLKAFELMVELGIWDVHENLAAHRFGLRRGFSSQVIQQANDVAEAPWIPESFREDFRGWWTLTIDGADTRDIDDGFSVRPTLDGGWELAIHIADPSTYFEKDSELDAAARARGTSVYLPDGVVPMFPTALSEGRMSLLVGQDRAAMTTHVIFDEALDVVSWRIVPSVVRVDRRLTYEEADQLLADEESREHVAEILGTLKWLADERLIERTQHGAVQIELPETQVKVNQGVIAIEVRQDSPSNAIVGELMIFCNELVATHLQTRRIPGIFRLQEPPDEPLDVEIQRVPAGPARQFAILKRMKRGDVSVHPGPHFGLGLQAYSQASSPIRRYSDLVIQRQLKAEYRGEPLPYDEAALLGVIADVERASYEASQIEREAREYWIVQWLSHQTTTFEAVVLEAAESRASVLIESIGFRASVRTRRLLSVGARVLVEVERADARGGVLMLRVDVVL